VPYISGAESHRWVVGQASSVNFTISDVDNDTVDMFAVTPLPTGSTFTRLTATRNTWQLVWTPLNVDPVQLTSVGPQLLTLPAEYAQHGLCNGCASICPSVCPVNRQQQRRPARRICC